MRLFCYYTWHSFINTIKKVFKTWLAFFAVCLAVGVLIGLIISAFLPKSSKDKAKTTEPTAVTDVEKEEEDPEDEIKIDVEKKLGFFASRDISKAAVVDVIITAVFLLSLAVNVSSAKKSGKIFKPADVPMLFASPMKPQSVLMFRLISTLAASLMISLYMVFQLPNLINNAKLGVWGAWSCIVAYAFMLIFGTLVQVTFYTITSRSERGTGDITNALLVFYGVIAAAFGIYKFATGKETVTAIFDFFGSKKTFWVPFWGWMRGMVYYAIEGNTALSLLFMALFVFACALMVVLIWKMKADFYEDALYETEKQAQMIENVKMAQKGVAIVRDKDRSSKLERDGFHQGSGASVFFFKAVYNHFRFSKFKIFSKTLIVYSLAAGVVAWLARGGSGKFDLFILPACALTLLTFYRTLGNPLKEDTSREFFVLIPESPLKKIWFSILGSTAECALDLSIPMIIAAIILKTNPINVIGWYVFILAVSIFGTAVGTLVNLSVPGDNAQTLKTLVQIFFLYFGLLPAVAFIALGMFLNMVTVMLLIGSVVIVGIGTIFTLATPHFLVNR
ncbi:MAG: putative ABC exporter domain-containing protein [Clostridiales bacterium]|nr:putative ABC exporter domain-containing protein [Clostridiales bacterium]